MEIKTFGDILALTKQRVNFTDTDADVDNVISTAINESYLELQRLEPQIFSTICPVINGVVSLPENILNIYSITPPLDERDKRIGTSILTDKTGEFTVRYSSMQEPLINSGDEPILNAKYFYSMSTYACYVYFIYKKKNDIAAAYLGLYESTLEKLKTKDVSQRARRSGFQRYFDEGES